ncbi:alpha/beta hydrolase [Paenibacillus gallinarum]|uniref:Alpha/beta hydrolase n=1 Tax=Paenibacillus gallinarum TaxID=2762232 RepID=A0ABR8T2W9_9BACL|nr:alpha/beta hydrolase-fold protein [Paenibacillus gallinarum]MBD7969960.1 alpha/beta hydrolase [Paenibacillus gallinarum]
MENTSMKKVTLAGTDAWSVTSGINGQEYRVQIYQPSGKVPASGFPIIYTLDGNSTFAMTAEMMRIQSLRPEKTGVAPAIVVSIGYNAEALFPPKRHYDFTMPAPEKDLPKIPFGRPLPEQGGALDFMSFVEDQLKPLVESRYSVDSSRQMIVGHSLGGLFVLHMLFVRPHSFHTYIAGSPSIHWNAMYLRQQEQKWLEEVSKGRTKLNTRVLIAVGELEGNLKVPMIRNAEEQVERLSKLEEFGVQVAYQAFEAENHMSIVPVLINRALRFNGWAEEESNESKK